MVIGYNEGWKTNINLGSKNNKKFYDIPSFINSKPVLKINKNASVD